MEYRSSSPDTVPEEAPAEDIDHLDLMIEIQLILEEEYPDED